MFLLPRWIFVITLLFPPQTAFAFPGDVSDAVAAAYDEGAWRALAAQDPFAGIEAMRVRLQGRLSADQRIRGYALLGALLSEELGDLMAGIDAYRAAIAVDPLDPQIADVRYALALGLISLGDYPAACKELALVLALRPDHPASFSIRATLEDLRGKPRLATPVSMLSRAPSSLPKPALLPRMAAPVTAVRSPVTAVVEQTIRVLVRRDYGHAITSDGTLFLFDGAASPLGTAAQKLACQAQEGRVRCDDRSAEVMQVIPAKGRDLILNGQRFRGVLILRVEAGKLLAINRISMEKYLYGVLPREVPFDWPLEALKAQAVAARTYAYSQIGRSGGLAYDVENTVMSQVYGGRGAERASTNDAVDQTRDEILRYQGQIVVAYFHSHSGGRTEDPRNVWGARLPYLVSQTDPHSLQTGAMRWSAVFSRGEVAALLRKELPELGTFQSLKVLSRNGQRVEKVKLIGSRGNVSLSGNRLRLLLGPGKLKSTAFTLQSRGASLTFHGQGYGHGVGLSQWGALAMSKKGVGYQAILNFYYRGVSIERIVLRD